MKKERVRRPKPSRTEPVRSWSTLLNAPGGGTEANGGGGRAPASLGDVVSRSVDLGYRVVDEYVRQGQRAARRMSDRSWEPEAMTRDAQDVMARMMQYGSDFFSVWMEFLELSAGATGRGVGLGTSMPRPGAPPAAPSPADRPSADAAPDRTRVRIQVVSVQPAEVSLDLRPDAAGLKLRVHALRAVDPDKPRLTDVALAAGRADEPLVLRIRVPDDQPAGTYNGMIVDEGTSRPAGTVSVRIGG